MSNIPLNSGSGGANLGSDQVAGTPNIDYEVVKIGFSLTGVTPVQVSTMNPLPVNVTAGAIAGFQDAAAYTAGTTPGLPFFGVYSDSASLTTGQAGAPRLTSLRQLLVGVQGVPVGGAIPFYKTAANSNNATNLKATPGSLYSIEVFNLTATIYYLKFYNKASAPAPATDNALLVQVFPIPANTAVGGIVMSLNTPKAFSTGISYAIVAGLADTDNTSVPSGSIVLNGSYF